MDDVKYGTRNKRGDWSSDVCSSDLFMKLEEIKRKQIMEE